MKFSVAHFSSDNENWQGITVLLLRHNFSTPTSLSAVSCSLASRNAWTEAHYTALWIPRADVEDSNYAHWLSKVPHYDHSWTPRADAEHAHYAY